MKLTAAQEAQIASERKAEPGKKSFMIETTPEQDAEYDAQLAVELAGKEANIAMAHRLEQLLAEDSFLGSLRRALESSARPWADLELASGVPALRLEQFYIGDADLTQQDINRLVRALGLQLVPADQPAATH